MNMDLPQAQASLIMILSMQTPPALIVSEKNSPINDKIRSQKNLDELARLKNQHIEPGYTYLSVGPLGIPSLSFRVPTDFKTSAGISSRDGSGKAVTYRTRNGFRYVNPNYFYPASQACAYLDFDNGGKLGTWGPGCLIIKTIKIPKNGVLGIHATGDQYSYTPGKPNTKDSFRFVLSNGEGKEVDVTINLDSYSDETDYSLK
ncbi:hypothetical protein ACO0LF_17185 [Undibacterium sp. Di27W]|uniref:hypothetical protein n=1 Tax=Undibacterium sp. Di27W TaxID=3413036 RepID=UPI003BF10FAF